ncbi:MAG: ADOP family duplicated permease [Vicinamibacterales bacterium]
MLQDFRYSVRLLLRHPAFTLTAISVLALGIGVNAGIFGLINGLLLRPLPGAEAAGEVMGLYSHDRTTERGYRAFSYRGFSDVREAGGPFATLAAHNVAMVGISEGNTTRQSFADIISTRYFETLGVAPVFGRDFTLDEERPGSQHRSVIVSYRYWERHNFDRDLLSKSVRVNGQDYGIIGVAPEGFGGTTAILGTELWLPLGVHDDIENDYNSRAHRQLADPETYVLVVFGRLKPGLTQAQAGEQMRVIAAAHESAYPAANKDRDLIVRPLSRLSISTSPSDDTQLYVPMAMLQGLAAAVLLTACLNLANMMLAFGTARQKEIAIRLAVGGGRGRIVRQLLMQGLLLSLVGGGIGLVIASWAMQILVSSISTVLPIAVLLNVTPDQRVLLATLAFSAGATIAFGLWPALQLSRPDLLAALKDQAGEVSGRLGRRVTVRGALVTVQLALSLALLILSGLFVRTAAAGASDDPGFRVDPLVVAQVEPKLGGYDDARGRDVQLTALERLRSTPGIEAAASASVLPFGDITVGTAVQREGPRLRNEDPEARGKLFRALEYTVSADYFRTLGLAMLRGREFTAAEEAGATGTEPVIIDAALAAQLYPDEDPVGRLLQFGAQYGGDDAQPMQIVGVAPPVRHDLMERDAEAHIYLPSGRSLANHLYVYARAAGGVEGGAILPAVRDQLLSIDAQIPLVSLKPFRTLHEQSASVWILRAAARLFLALGLAAAFVAVVGLYGVRSYLVSRRSREFGVRMAVGAAPRDVLRLVMREAIVTTSAGLAGGLVLGAVLGFGLSRIMYQVSPFDVVTLATAAAVLGLASLGAAFIPAWRAAGISPSTAIRATD